MNQITRTDAYTKIVLTVIAGCLLWLCANNVALAPAAYARGEAPATAPGVTNVSLSDQAAQQQDADTGSVMAVKIVGFEMAGALPVVMASAPTTPVHIIGVDVASEWGPRNTLPVTFPSNTNWPVVYQR